MAHKICPACGTELYFLISSKGNKVPVRADKLTAIEKAHLDNGRDVDFIYKQHEAHFVDCPKADRFRKSSK